MRSLRGARKSPALSSASCQDLAIERIGIAPCQPESHRRAAAQGRVVASKYYERYYGDTVQVLFTADKGVFYLSDTAGGLLNARLRSRGINPGELITIT